ncbi:hypothetical protein [Brevibacillus sp. SYSU BS000544]|uniref:hypothetical protein n=1 Tax=Brevibacillus sp. SYSU BS000544 TaxID=3416443 RepID=UPI003CE461C2
MTRLAFWLTVLAAVTGFGLFVPASPGLWKVYSSLLVVHIVTSICVLGLILIVSFTHALKMMKVTKKGQVKKISGIIYLVTVLVAIGTGIFLTVRSGFAVSWMVSLHVVAGSWCLVYGWKHSVKKNHKQSQHHHVAENLLKEDFHASSTHSRNQTGAIM